MEYGLPADFPAALVEQGTTPMQRVHIATLGSLAEHVKNTDVRAPTLIIVGEVVKLHKNLAWFNPWNRYAPLKFGKGHIDQKNAIKRDCGMNAAVAL